MTERKGTGEDGSTEERVKPLELFFDLVFVLAFTQVTGMMSDDPTWGGLARGMLILAAVWWAWVGYAWMTNLVDPDEVGTRLSIFAVMASMLIVALAVPGAFEADALVFGVAYFIVRILHLVLYALGSEDEGVRQSIRGFAVTAVLGPSLILLASAFDGAAQGILWAAALLIDFGGPKLRGVEGWRVSAGHFAERHGLIVIIALGESIVAIGIGASDRTVDLGIVAAAVLGTALTAALWWSYFDVAALASERHLREETDRAKRNARARDVYSYLHLALIAGIVLMALGFKKTIEHTGDPLKDATAVALCGGLALFHLGGVASRLRNSGALSRQRLIAAVACLALIPLALEAPALAALGAVTAVCVTLVAYEAIRFHESRKRTRAAHAP